MSLEVYRNNQNLPKELERYRNKDRITQSPIHAFAAMMIEDAETELISLNRGKQTPIASVLTMNRPSDMSKKGFAYRKGVEGMIYFGNIVIEIEDIIRTGYYDHTAFCERINLSIGKYAKYEEDKIEKWNKPVSIDSIQSRAFPKLAQNDPTFAIFIEQLQILLPAPLLKVLKEQKITKHVQAMVVDYKEVAQRLVQKNFTVYSSKAYQALTLDLFDSLTERIEKS